MPLTSIAWVRDCGASSDVVPARRMGYPYSDDAIKAERAVWNPQTLDKWLADPGALVLGNDMSFRVEKPEERMAIIECLRNLK